MSMASSSPSEIFLSIILCLSLAAAKSSPARTSGLESQEADRVTYLPGQPSNPIISQFSGYITVNKDHGRALFYWFFEAESETSEKPLLLWLNGGPGCSSIGYGAAAELGPLRVDKTGNLFYNEYAWNKEAYLLFVESPVGVGFSYTNESSDLTSLDDSFVAEDAYSFLLNWMQRFPQFQNREFYIAGESYAGHYVPQLAELIYDRNRGENKVPLINLKGFIVGNPETNDYYDCKGLLEYAWSHAVISDQLYDQAKQACDFRLSIWSNECNAFMNEVYRKYDEISIYNIYSQICLINSTSSSVTANLAAEPLSKKNGSVSRRMRIRGGYDPCYSKHTEEYFNRLDVQLLLHANIKPGNTSINWKVCNDSIFRTYNFSVFSVLPIYKKLVQGGLRIWVYSGDMDGRVPVIGSRYCMEDLGLPLISEWRSWFHKNQVGGRTVEYKGLTFATVRGAGHLVPLDKPSEALSLIHSFLTAQSLPAHQ